MLAQSEDLILKSKDIRDNLIYPDYITKHKVFAKDIEFKKIFPLIDLNNFKININNLKLNGFHKVLFKKAINLFNINKRDKIKGPWWKYDDYLFAKSASIINDYIDLVIDYSDDIDPLKKDIKSNITNLNFNIIFSSCGITGAHDLTTMSMRGIKSCQTWHCNQSKKLVGSIIDPCCGIMYVERGDSIIQTLNDNGDRVSLGSEMMFRSIVRYVFNEKIGHCLYLEPIYRQSNYYKFNISLSIFAHILSKKTGLTVLTRKCLDNNVETFIPLSKNVFNNLKDSSYTDSGLKYSALPLILKNKLLNTEELEFLYT